MLSGECGYSPKPLRIIPLPRGVAGVYAEKTKIAKRETAESTALALLKMDKLSLEDIAEGTGLSFEEVKELSESGKLLN